MRRPLLVLPFLLAAGASPLAAQDAIPASRWKTVLTGDDGTTMAIDSATIYRAGDSIFSIRSAVRFGAPVTLPTGETVDREVDAEELDCGAARARGVYSELWSGERPLRTTPLANTWASVSPGRRAVFDASCAWLLGGFAARLRRTYDLTAVEEQPELANRREVAAAANREYPSVLRNGGATGVVTLRMRVLEDGTVERSSVDILTSDHPQFAAAARRVVWVMRFRPARVRGQPVAVWVDLPVVFRRVTGQPPQQSEPAGFPPLPPTPGPRPPPVRP